MSVVLSRSSGKGKKLVLKVSLSATNLPDSTAVVVGVWRQDTNQIIGHTDVVKGEADPTFTVAAELDHFMAEDLPVKFCVYSAANDPVSASDFIGSHETTLNDLFKKKNQTQPLEGADGASIVFKVTVLADPNAKKKEKKPPKVEGPKLTKAEAAAAKAREKEIKAAIKEGGKKGQDLCGMSSFGVHYFCVSMEAPGDDWELMESCMTGMNKEVDPEADDRKGGAGDLGKILFSAGDKKLLMMCHVPAELEGSDVQEFLKAVGEPVGANFISFNDSIGKAEAIGDPDANKYPLKMKDEAIAAGFAYLRGKNLVLDDDDSDDDINFADDCGIDLNGGAEGSDY